MKIVCTKSNLVKGVSIVSKAVPSKTTMSILECVLIDATTDIIRLTAKRYGTWYSDRHRR
jgi:DNA polymerase III, beta subunit (EC 2.7.7.7)